MAAESFRQARPRDLDLATPPMTRNASISSDKPSSLSRWGSMASPPPGMRPEAGYIAVSAASQIITNDHENLSHMWHDDGEIEPSGETVRVSPESLKKVNAFLDYLLHRFLAVARSTSLVALKPAVNEVLKRKLAKEAVAGADQELMEYMGGANEELVAYYNGQDPTGNWDLELAWKRTRLRCMVYSSLGDMEEEDEKLFADQESLDSPAGMNGDFTDDSGIVSPAVAIFLTSILEFIGEQALIVAGQAAYTRIRQERALKRNSMAETSSRDSTVSTSTTNEIAERITVEELDTEKVAANVSLGRLWRTWKKSVRSPTNSYSRPMSQDSFINSQLRRPSFSNSSRRSSVNGAVDEAVGGISRGPAKKELKEVPEEDLPLTIPLPMAENDVEQIEVPGLAPTYESDTESIHTQVPEPMQRSQSMSVLRPSVAELFTPVVSSPQTPTKGVSSSSSTPRPRSRSVPLPDRRPLVLPEDPVESPAQEDFVTPFEKADPMEKETSDLTAEHKPDMVQQSTAKKGVEESGPKTRDQQETELRSSAAEDKSHQSSKKGIISGIMAGAAALGTAAVAGTVLSSTENKSKDKDAVSTKAATEKGPAAVGSKAQLEKALDDDDVEEAQIMESTRMSLEGKKAPEIVQTRSRATSTSPSTKTPIDRKEEMPKISPFSDEDEQNHDPMEIGVARTSNVSVPAVVSPASPMPSTGRPSPDNKMRQDRSEHLEQTKEKEVGDVKGDAAVDEQELKPKPQFVLAAAPPSRVAKGLTEQTPNGLLSESPSSNSLAPASRTPGAEHGVPPLTPLREMMEAAHDTSDEASSIAPSHGTSHSNHSISSLTNTQGHRAHEQSISSNYSHGKQASTSSSKYSEHRAPQTVTYPPPDRAAVQRVFTPTAATFDAAAGKPRRSDSLTKGQQRQIHTSGSGTSQVSHKIKGLIGNLHEVSDKPLPQLRASEDEGTKTVENFDKLIESGETLQYTLTPQTVRETDTTPPSVTPPQKDPVVQPVAKQAEPVDNKSARGETAELAEFIRTTGPPQIEQVRPPEHRSTHSFSRPTPVPNGLRSNPPATTVTPVEPAVVKPKPYIPKTIPIPPSKRSRPTRPGMPQAREARPLMNSTRDIVEFLRVTGPDGQIMPAARAHVTQSATSLRGVSSANGRLNGTVSPAGSAQNYQFSRAESTTGSERTRLRLQAREATVPFGEGSAELADFIRQGPPTNQPVPEGRRPQRLQESSNRPVNTISAVSSIPDIHNMGPAPIRKQRRVKDPYAIDVDSDEEYDLYEGGPGKVKEESLADFLMSVAPPKSSQPQSLQNTAAAARILQNAKQNGGNQAGSTATTSASMAPAPGANNLVRAAGGRSGTSNAVSARLANAAPQLSLSQESASPLFPVSGGLGMDGYTGRSGGSEAGSYVSTSYASTSNRRPNPGLQSRMNPGLQSRVARNDDGNLHEVADFLKSSGPPPSSSTYVPPAKEKGAISKFFRKKKAAAA